MTFAALDYPPEKLAPFGRDKITLEANTEQEQTMRVVACSKEPWTTALIESLAEGECFWDIGANVGSYTLLARARKLVVVAFEPVAENHATLCRNLARNGMLDQVIVIPLALGPMVGLTWIHLTDMRSGSASHLLTSEARKSTYHKQLLPIITGDKLIEMYDLPKPHAIKLDVDGCEPDVMRGLEETLNGEQLRVLMIELHDQWDGALTLWMQERGWMVAESFEHRGPIYYARFERG